MIHVDVEKLDFADIGSIEEVAREFQDAIEKQFGRRKVKLFQDRIVKKYLPPTLKIIDVSTLEDSGVRGREAKLFIVDEH